MNIFSQLTKYKTSHSLTKTNIFYTFLSILVFAIFLYVGYSIYLSKNQTSKKSLIPAPSSLNKTTNDEVLTREAYEINGVDKETLIVYTPPEYAKDKNNVYCRNDNRKYNAKEHKYDNSYSVLESADPATFEIVYGKISSSENNTYRGTWDYVYSRDSKSLYFKCQKLLDANPKTFSLLRNDQTWDQPNTLGEPLGRDENSVYAGSKKLPLVDASTLKLVEFINGSTTSPTPYLTDKEHVYCYDTESYGALKILPANPKTFSVIDSYNEVGYSKFGEYTILFSYANDLKNLFYGCLPVKGIKDPKSFRFLTKERDIAIDLTSVYNCSALPIYTYSRGDSACRTVEVKDRATLRPVQTDSNSKTGNQVLNNYYLDNQAVYYASTLDLKVLSGVNPLTVKVCVESKKCDIESDGIQFRFGEQIVQK